MKFTESQAMMVVTMKITVLSNLCLMVWKKRACTSRKLSVFIKNAVHDICYEPNRMHGGLTATAFLITGKHEVKMKHFCKHVSTFHDCCTKDYKYCLRWIWRMLKHLTDFITEHYTFYLGVNCACYLKVLPSPKRLRWSSLACWPLAEAIRFFGRKKILSMTSFRGEVKPSVPCRSFATCKKNPTISVKVMIVG
jgi:hypothetical protein